MKRGGPEHPKVHALASLLGKPKYAAVGILESLWHFAQEYAQAGDIGRYSDDAIARWVCWDDASTVLVDALVEAGWLDKCDCHRLRIHDWPQHADQTVQRVLANKHQSFIPCYDHASTVLAPSKLPCRTKPSHTKPVTDTDSRGASAPTATKRPRKPRALPPDSAHAVAEACDDWTEALGGTAPGKRIAGAWPGLLKLAPWSDVRPVWQWYLAEGKASGKAEFCNPQEFSGKFDYWRQRCNGLVAAPRAPGRQIESVAEENLASLRRVLAESGQTLEGELARVGGFGLVDVP